MFQNWSNIKKSYLKEGIPITESNFYAHINQQEFDHIFRSDSVIQIPLSETRLKVLRETGKILVEVCDLTNIVKRIVNNFIFKY